MKPVLLSVVLLLGVSVGSALAAAGPTHSLTDGEVLRGRFTQERHFKGFAVPLKSEGRFVLAPGAGLIWQADKPFPIVTVITAAGLVQEAGGAETARLPAKRLPFLARLYDMLRGALAGDWQALDAHFVVARTGDDRRWEVGLTPRQADDGVAMPIRSIAMKGSRFVDAVEIVRPDGDLDRLAFLDQVVSTGPFTDEEAALFRTVPR